MKKIKLGSPQFKKLQQAWYKKDAKLAAKKGEIDVERYQDFNKFPASTMPRAHGSFLFDPETGEILDEDEIIPLQDTDRAGFWREVGRKAAELPRGHKRKDKLLYDLVHAFAEHGTYVDAARECGIQRKAAERRINKWLASNDLRHDYYKQDHEPPPEPAPCRTLTKAEIAKLDLKPPRGK